MIFRVNRARYHYRIITGQNLDFYVITLQNLDFYDITLHNDPVMISRADRARNIGNQT